MSLRLYFQHILRTLLCIGAMATLFCQQSHAVTGNDGQEYFFIQFVNIEGNSRFVRALWRDSYGVEVGRMQTDNEQQGLISDPVGFWRWDGDLLVCYYTTSPPPSRSSSLLSRISGTHRHRTLQMHH